MPAPKFNLINETELKTLLKKNENFREDYPQKSAEMIRAWLSQNAFNSLAQDPRCLKEVQELPPNPSRHLIETQKRGEPVYQFDPSPEILKELETIFSYLEYAFDQDRETQQLHREAMPQEVRPPKQLNQLSYSQALAKANDLQKLREKAQALAALASKGEKVVMEFESGWKIVGITTTDSLKIEGARMGNCLGDKEIYHEIPEEELPKYLSLRDPSGKPQVDIELEVESHYLFSECYVLSECKGRLNRKTTLEQQAYLQAFLKSRHSMIFRDTENVGLIGGPHPEEYYTLDQWKNEDIYFSDTVEYLRPELTGFPKKLHVAGNLNLESSKSFDWPQELIVEGQLNLYEFDFENTTFPQKPVIECEEIVLEECRNTGGFYPKLIVTKGDLDLRETSIELAAGSKIKGDLYLSSSPTKIGMGTFVEGTTYIQEAETNRFFEDEETTDIKIPEALFPYNFQSPVCYIDSVGFEYPLKNPDDTQNEHDDCYQIYNPSQIEALSSQAPWKAPRFQTIAFDLPASMGSGCPIETSLARGL